MFTRVLTAAAIAFTLVQVPVHAAGIAPDGKEKATAACQGMNEYGPVEVQTAVEDGLGDWLVWIKDKDGDLWMCNANAQGAVFTNVLMQGDLLKGAGASLIGLRQVADRGGSSGPAIAEALCSAVGSHIEEMQVVGTVDDGLGDHITWLKNAEDQLWICNASGDAKLYDFEPVDLPLNDVGPVDFRYA